MKGQFVPKVGQLKARYCLPTKFAMNEEFCSMRISGLVLSIIAVIQNKVAQIVLLTQNLEFRRKEL